MKAILSRCISLNAAVPVVFSLACAGLMILAAWWKRDLPVGSSLHTTLDWAVQFLVVFVIVGISVAGVSPRRASCDGPTR